MAEINLLQTQSTISQVRDQGKRWLFRLAILILIVVVGAYLILLFSNWRTDNRLDYSQNKIRQVQETLSNNKKRSELVTRQAQISHINKLLSNHLYWSEFLPELSRVTLSQAQYSIIEVDKEGRLNLTVTVPTYADAEKYLQVFDLPEYNQRFSNVKILSLSKIQQDEVIKTTMRLQLTLNSDLLKK
jgi:hypothetical protein